MVLDYFGYLGIYILEETGIPQRDVENKLGYHVFWVY